MVHIFEFQVFKSFIIPIRNKFGKIDLTRYCSYSIRIRISLLVRIFGTAPFFVWFMDYTFILYQKIVDSKYQISLISYQWILILYRSTSCLFLEFKQYSIMSTHLILPGITNETEFED
jgi:hypothetical protein